MVINPFCAVKIIGIAFEGFKKCGASPYFTTLPASITANKGFSMEKAIVETFRRRTIQDEYNKKNGIVPKTIYKDIHESLTIESKVEEDSGIIDMTSLSEMSNMEKKKLISNLESQMKEAAKNLDFEQAMSLRDIIFELKASL